MADETFDGTIEDDDQIKELPPSSTVLAALNASEIDMQISTAKRYPRTLKVSREKMIALATVDVETAKGCGYSLRRKAQGGGFSFIEGPSIRMAEIAISCWGNIRYGARIVAEDKDFITAQGVCHDLENNVSSMIEVRRRISGRDGRTYSKDMIAVTGNAACAIAARNAVFKVIPRAIINGAYNAAMKTACGDEKSFTDRRKGAVAEFQKLGFKTEQVMKVLGKPSGGIEDIDHIDLRRLHGLLTAIQDGEITAESIFADPEEKESQSQRSVNLQNKVKENAKQTTPPPPTKPIVAEKQKMDDAEADRIIQEKAALAKKTADENAAKIAGAAPSEQQTEQKPAEEKKEPTGGEGVHPLRDVYDAGQEHWERALLDVLNKNNSNVNRKMVVGALAQFAKERNVPVAKLTIEQLNLIFVGAEAYGIDMVSGKVHMRDPFAAT